MSLSRWFFRWAQWDTKGTQGQEVEKIDRIMRLPMKGKFEQATLGFDKEVYAIAFDPKFWDFGPGNWTRGGLRHSLEKRIALDKAALPVKRCITAMLWSCDEELLGIPRRVLELKSDVVEEVSIAWGWIGHFIQQPVMWQKSTEPEEAVKEFDSWLTKVTGTLKHPRLPPLPE